MTSKQILRATLLLIFALSRNSQAAESGDENGDTNTIVTVQTGTLQKATLHEYVEGFGSVGPAPAAQDQPAATSLVASPVAGIAARVLVWEGEHVKKGDALVQLDSRVADIAVEFAQKNVSRQQELLRLNNASQKSLQDAQQQLDAAKAEQALLRICAPLDGTVTRVMIHAGEAVDLTTALAEITDLTRLVVTANIPAAEAAKLKSGQPVDLLTDPPLRASVSFVSPAMDPTNGTVMIRAPIPAGADLRPGQFASVRVVVAEHADCLAAPAESVVTGPGGKPVLAVVNNNTAAQLPVTVGLRENGLVEVAAPGLQAGQTVVTVGAYGLPPHTQIKVENPPPP